MQSLTYGNEAIILTTSTISLTYSTVSSPSQVEPVGSSYSSNPSIKRQSREVDEWAMLRLRRVSSSSFLVHGAEEKGAALQRSGQTAGMKDGHCLKISKRRERRRPCWDFCIGEPVMVK